MANRFIATALPKQLRLARVQYSAAPYVPMRGLATTTSDASAASSSAEKVHPRARPLTQKEREFLERAVSVASTYLHVYDGGTILVSS